MQTTTTKARRPRLSPQDRQAMQAAALERASNPRSIANMTIVISEFMERGIPAGEIIPGENVLTFNAWRALGRTVTRGQKGVKIATMRPTVDATTGEEKKIFTTAYVFHISQTAPLEERN